MELFERVGKEAGVSALVDAFYGHMAEAPELKPLLDLHPDLPRARDRLYEFLVGWFGGPPLYISKHGHPRLRARHLHVKVDRQQVRLWMQCMGHALATTVADEEVRAVLHANFARMAAHMQNVPDPE